VEEYSSSTLGVKHAVLLGKSVVFVLEKKNAGTLQEGVDSETGTRHCVILPYFHQS
jgi:hypothetical protein